MPEWYEQYKCGDCLNLCGHQWQANEYCMRRKMKMNNWDMACDCLDLGPVRMRAVKEK